MLPHPENRVKLGYLLDCYGDFLTPRQKNLFTQYVNEDCSLSEIAQREGISPQAVSDALRHAQRTLVDMEEKLGVLERTRKTKHVIAQVKLHLQGLELKEADARVMNRELDDLLKIWEE